MKTNDKEKLCLTSDEAEYIKNLVLRNKYVIQAVAKSVLQEKYEYMVEDCVSEVYCLACTKAKKLIKHEKPDAWIVVATRKVALNMARKQETRLRRTADKEVDTVSVPDTVFENALYNIWLEKGVIEEILSTLTPHEREIYELLYKKRLTSKQTAEIMGVSDSTIRNINSTIREKIKNAIKTKLF